MIRIPPFWRRFKLLMTAQDLLMGRKVMITTNLDNGTSRTRITTA